MWVNHPLVQLTLWRFRAFRREPEAVFWVFCFPILLAAGLGLAFRQSPPEILKVATVTTELAKSLRLARSSGHDSDGECALGGWIPHCGRAAQEADEAPDRIPHAAAFLLAVVLVNVVMMPMCLGSGVFFMKFFRWR